MWKLWRLNNRSHDGILLHLCCQWLSIPISDTDAGASEEHELESVPDTASGGYNNTPPTRGSLAPSEPSTADNTPPTRGSLEPSELSAGDTTGVNMDDTEPAVGEDKDVQL